MPHSFRSTLGQREGADRGAFWRADREPIPPPFHRRGAGTGEAPWHHNEAFEHLCARVEVLGSRLQQARAALSGERANLLDGVVDALGGLKAGIAGMRRTWQGDEPWPAEPAPASPRPVGAVPWPAGLDPEPWDSETAEALTRVCEIAAFEEHRPKRHHRPRPQPGGRAAGPAPTSAGGSALEARLAALAEALQQALPRVDPAHWLGPIDVRIGQLEQDVAAALQQVAIRPDPDGLHRVEAMLRDLARRAEQTGAELARLDAIEGRLRELLTQLKSFDAAAKPAAAPPATDPSDPRALAELLKASVAARRQDARLAIGALQSIHRAIAEVVERLDGAPSELALAVDPLGANDPYADHDLLQKAYREGARALGESIPDAAQEPGLAGPNRNSTRPAPPRWHWQIKD